MINPFQFLPSTFFAESRKKIMYVTALASGSWLYATDYAVVNDSNYSGGQSLSSLDIEFTDNLDSAANQENYKFLVNISGNYYTAGGDTRLQNFGSEDNLFLTNTIFTVDEGPFSPLAVHMNVALEAAQTFAGTLDVANMSTLLFVMNGHQLTLSNGSALKGAGDISFSAGTSAGTIVSQASLTDLTGTLNINENTLRIENSPTLTGPLDGMTGSVLITDSGTTTLLNANNTYTGTIEVQNGTLALASTPRDTDPSNPGAGFGTGILMSNGTTLNLTGTSNEIKTFKSFNTEHANPAPGVTVNMGPALVIVNNTDANTFGGVLQNTDTTAGSFKKLGDGALTLNASNTYTGSTQVAGGSVVFGADNALGTGALSITNATVDVQGHSLGNSSMTLSNLGKLENSDVENALTYAQTVTVNGNATIQGGGDVTLSGTFNHATANQTFFKDGTGSLTLSGNLGNITSPINIQNGTLKIGSNSAQYTISSTITGAAAGTLEKIGSQQLMLSGDLGGLAGTISLDSGILYILNGSSYTLNSSIITPESGTGQLTKGGGGVLTLAGTNTYTGPTLITGGDVVFEADNALGAGVLTLQGGLVQLQGRPLNNSEIVFTGGALYNGSQTNTPDATGAVTYDGNVTVTTTRGTIRGAKTLTLTGDFTHTVGGTIFNKYDGGVLQLQGDINSTSNILLDAGVLDIGRNGDGQLVDSVITGAGTLRKSGDNTLTLNASNTYSGSTQVTGGSVVFGANNALGTGALSITNATVDVQGHSLGNSSMTLSNLGKLENSDAENALTYAQTVTVNGNATIQGDGDVTLSGTFNHATAGQTLSKDGTGSLTLSGNLGNISSAIDINDGKLRIGSNSAQYTISSTITGEAAGTLEKIGSQQLMLSGDLEGFAGTISLDSGILYILNGSSYTLNSSIITPESGTGQLTKGGGGVLTLAGTNTYTGPTLITGGDVVFEADNALGAGVLTLQGGLVQLQGRPLNNSEIVFTGGALYNGSQTNTPDATGAVTYDGNVTVTTTRGTIRGAKTLTLTGDFTHTVGGTIFNKYDGGVLQLQGDINSTSNILLDAGVLDIGRNGDGQLVDSVITGAGTLRKSGDNTLTLNKSLAGLTGPIEINTGKISIENVADYTLSSTLSGSGELRKAATGTLTIDGNNALYAGAVEVAEGVVIVGANNALGSENIGITGGELQVGSWQIANPNVVIYQEGTFSIGGTSLNQTLSADISNSGTFNKVGPNTLGLSGDLSSFNGSLVISSGALSFNTEEHYILPATVEGAGGFQKDAINNLAVTGSFENFTGNVAINNGALIVAGLDPNTDDSEGSIAGYTNPLGTGGITIDAAGHLLINPETATNYNGYTSSMTFTNSSLTLNGGGLDKQDANLLATFNSPVTVSAASEIASVGSLAFDGILSGSGALTLIGGDITFSNTGNTYSGDFNIQSGHLTLASTTDQTSGMGLNLGLETTITLTGGNSAKYFNTITGIGTVNMGEGTVYIGNTDTNTFDGVLQDSDGETAGSLYKYAAGNLILNSENPYTGSTTVAGGQVTLGHSNALGTGALIINNAIVDVSGYPFNNSSMTLNDGGVLENSDAGIEATVSYSNTVTIAGDATIRGAGDIMLDGAFNHEASNKTLLKDGTGSLTLEGDLGHISSAIQIDNGTLRIGSDSTEYTISSTITGETVGTLEKIGGEKLTLSGNLGSYPGAITLTSGTLAIGNDTAAYTLSSEITGAGNLEKTGTEKITLTGSISGITGDVLLNEGVLAFAHTDAETLNAKITNTSPTASGSFEKLGAGILTLAAENDFTGNATIQAGGVTLNAAGALGAGTLRLNGGFVELSGQQLSNSTLEFNGGTLQNASNAVTYAGSVSVLDDSTVAGAGDITFTNSFTHNQTNTNFTKNGSGILTLSGGLVTGGSSTFTIDAGELKVGNDSQADTISGNILGNSGSAVLRKIGSNNLTINGLLGSYSGNIAIDSGKVILNPTANNYAYAGAISGAGALEKAGTRVIQLTGDLSGLTGTMSLVGGAIELNPSESYTLPADIVGTTAGTIISKLGSHKVTLSGDLSGYTRSFALNGGVLALGSSEANSDYELQATFSSMNGGSLEKTGTNRIAITSSLSGASFGINIAEGALALGNNGSNYTFSSPLTGSGIFEKAGSNVVTLQGENTGFEGPVLISDGRLHLTNNDALGTGAITINNQGGLSVGFVGLQLNNAVFLNGGAIYGGSYTGDVSIQQTSSFLSNPISISGAISNTEGANIIIDQATLSLSGNISGLDADIDMRNGGALELTNIGEHILNSNLTSSEGEPGLLQFRENSGIWTVAGSADNTHGRTEILEGKVTLAKNNALGQGSLYVSGHLDTAGFSLNNNEMTLINGLLENSSNTLVSHNAPTIFSGDSLIEVAGDLALTGGITFTLNTEDLVVQLSKTGEGTLSFEGPLLPSDPTVIQLFNGVFAVGGGENTDYTLAASLIGFPNDGSGNYDAEGVIGSFKKIGLGSITLGGTNPNTYQGDSDIAAGTLVFAKNNALGSGALSIQSGATVDVAGYTVGNSSVSVGGGTLANLQGESTTTIVPAVTLTSSSTLETIGDLTFSGQVVATDANYLLTKTGDGTATFDLTSNLNTKLNITEGSVEIQGGIGANLTSAAVSAGASIHLYGTDLITAKDINALAISGEGTLHLHNGRIDLRDSTLSIDNINIHAAGGQDTLVANVMIDDDSFVPNTVILNGVLEGYYTNSSTIDSTMTGTGLFRKYGSGALDFSGDLSGFTGNMELYAGNVTGNLGLGVTQIHIRGGTLLAGHGDTSYTIASTLISSDGQGSFEKTGSGTITLSGSSANTYSSPSNINAGTVLLNKENALGTGIVTITGGGTRLDLQGHLLSNAAITLAGGTLENSGGLVTYSQSLTIEESSTIQGAGSLTFTGPLLQTGSASNTILTKAGTGTLTFAGNISGYSRGIALNAGTLEVGSHGAAYTLSSVMTGSGTFRKIGTRDLTLSGDLSGYNGAINISMGNLLIGNSAANYTLTSNIDGVGGLQKTGTNTITLSGDLGAFSGSISLNAGTLAIGSNNDSYTLSSNISGSAALQKVGSNAITLSGTNTFSGPISITDGSIILGSNNALGGGALTLQTEGTLDIAGRTLSNNSLTLNGGTVTNSGTAVSYTHNVTVSNSSIINGDGDLTITGSLLDTNSDSETVLTKNGSATLTLTGNVSGYTRGIALDGGTLAVGNSSASNTLSSAITGAGAFSKIGSNTLTLSGDLGDYEGPISITAGRLKIGNNTADYVLSSNFDGTGQLEKDGARKITLTGSLQNFSGDLLLTGGTLAIGNDTTDYTVASNISGTGAFEKVGENHVTLTGENTFYGSAVIYNGTVTLGTNDALGNGVLTINSIVDFAGHSLSNSAIALNGGTLRNSTGEGTYDYGVIVSVDSTLNAASHITLSGEITHNTSGVVLTKNGAGNLTLMGDFTDCTRDIVISDGLLKIGRPTGSQALSSLLSGSGSFEKINESHLSLSAENTFTGSATISAGQVQLFADHALGLGDLTIGSGALVETAGKPIGNNSITLSGGTLTNTENVTLGYDNQVTVTDNATIGGLGNFTFNGEFAHNTANKILTKTGDGVVTLTGDISATTSRIDIAGGTLAVGNASGSSTLASALTGEGSFEKVNASTLILTGANTFAGSAIVSEGTLQLGVNNALGIGGLSVNNATLDLQGRSLSNSSLSLSSATLLNSNNSFSYGNQITIEGNNTIQADTDITFSGLFVYDDSEAVLQKNGGGVLTLSGDFSQSTGSIVINDGTLVLDNSSSAYTFASQLSGAGGFNKTGTAKLILSSTNTFEGSAIIEEGEVELGAFAALGDGELHITSGATVDLYGYTLNNTSVNIHGGSLENNLRGGEPDPFNPTQMVYYNRDVTITQTSIIGGSAPLTLEGTLAHNTTGMTLTKIGDATLVLAGDISNVDAAINISAGKLAIGNNFNDGILDSQLSGAGAFEKIGSNTLTLQKANTFSGRADVSGGNLVMAHDNALGSGALYIHSGATLNVAGHAINNSTVTLNGGSLQNSQNGASFSYGNIAMTDNSTIGGAGDYALTGTVGSPSAYTLTKNGAGRLVLSSASTLNSSLEVQEGIVEIRGAVGANFTQATIAQDAHVYLDGSNLTVRKDINGVAFTGEGTLHLRNGWLDLRDSDLTVSHINIHAASSDPEFSIARVMIDESFNPSTTINIDGILQAHINADISIDGYDLENTITGTGLLKKYGSGTLNLTGDLSGFTGAIQVFEGIVTTNQTRASDLELYTGSTLIADVENSAGQTATLQGNLFGAVFTNEGTLHLGNNSDATQIVSYGEWFDNRGDIYFNDQNYGHVRVNAFDAPEDISSYYEDNYYHYYWHWGNFFVPNGTLTLNGHFYNSEGNDYYYYYYHNLLYAYGSGEISFDPGSSYDGYVYVGEGGKIRLQGSNIDENIELTHVYSIWKGVVDIGVDKINDVTSTMSVTVNDFSLDYGGTVVFRPDTASTSADAPLLVITDSLYLPDDSYYQYYSHYYSQEDLSTNIRILPQGDASTSEPITVNLMRIGASVNTDNNKEKILAALKTGLLYDIEDAVFVDADDASGDAILTVLLNYKAPAQLLNNPIAIQGIPAFYEALARSMLAQYSNTNNFAQGLYDGVANSLSSFSILDHLRYYEPVGALPSSLYQPVTSSVKSGSLVHVHKQNSIVTRLMGQHGASSVGHSELHPLFDKIFAFNKQDTERYKKHAANQGQNPAGPQLESFRYVNLDGFSFDSELQYSHQNEPNRSADEIGYSSHSWTASLGASFSQQGRYSIGTLIATTKTHERMNHNDKQKAGHKDDRVNTIGALGYYNFETLPVTISALASYAQHNYDQVRNWFEPIETNEVVEMTASAQYEAYETSVQSEIGYTYHYSDLLAIQPFVAATWTKTKNGAYTESSSRVSTGIANDRGYIVPEQSYSSALYSLGLEFAGMRRINDVESTFFARVGFSTQKNSGEKSTFKYAIAAAPDAALEMTYKNYRYNTADVMVGVHTALTEGLSLTAVYNAKIGEDLKNHNASLSLDYSF